VRLTPGESLTIPPGTIHQFWAEEGTGWEFEGGRYSLSSEISSVCDDWNDNVFFEKWAIRFPQIVEDEPREFYLCQECPKAWEGPGQ
jgi:D-lyxose ketol-isomerase